VAQEESEVMLPSTSIGISELEELSMPKKARASSLVLKLLKTAPE